MAVPEWLSRWQGRLRTEDDLVRFVDDVGFCTINELERWPEFPSQEVAMDRRDVLGHTWFWKDDLHNRKRIYYSRVFAGKPGFISFDFLPAFIATNGEAIDELALYGRLPVLSQDIHRIIEQQGPISSKDIKALLGPEGRKAAAGALIDLERRFIITKTDITGRERGTYGYVWDLAERWVPEAFEAADRLGVKAAAKRIRERAKEHGVIVDREFEARVLRWAEGIG